MTERQPIKNGQRTWNVYFFKEDIQMTKKYIKRCSVSFIIREMKMKNTMRYPFTRGV